MNFVKITIISMLLTVITACSHLYGDHGVIKNRDTDYLKAQSIQPIKIPAGYSSDSMESLYPVSDKQFSTSQMKANLTPPELYATIN
jgi:uncharacterized lipoprotein